MPIALLITFLSYFITQILSMTAFYQRINNTIYDSLFRITKTGDPRTKGASIIAINDIDLNEMEEKYQFSWPWPRMCYGLISDFLIENGAKAVVFDIVFSEVDIDREKLGILASSSDSYFRSIITSTNKVVLPLNIDNSFESRTIPDPIIPEVMSAIFQESNDSYRELIESAYEFDDNYNLLP